MSTTADHWNVVVIGAGAAGLLAAARAAERGKQTLLLEKNRRPGVKILMSGGTRCNLTHHTDERGIIEGFGPAGRFLHSALAALGPRELVALVEAEGVATKIEETGKIFPVSNRAADVLRALLARLSRSGATLALEEPVTAIARQTESGEEPAGFVITTSHRVIGAKKIILTTGGRSYPGCGTTGDGYAWAEALGHSLVPTRPALTPLTTAAAWVPPLSGITIEDVHVRVIESDRILHNHEEVREGEPLREGEAPAVPMTCESRGSAGASPSQRTSPSPRRQKKPLTERRSSLLFTHFGLSGPAAMDVSRAVSGHDRPQELDLVCDFLPDASAEQLDRHFQQQRKTGGGQQLANVLPEIIPRRLAQTLIEQAGLDPQSRLAELSKTGQARLIAAIKSLAIPLSGTRGFKKAEVTAGGIPLNEVNSSTMESKRAAGLYLAGEILDLDGRIGGYNFQSAFSTGWLAGESV